MKELRSETIERLQSPSVILMYTGKGKAGISGIEITCKINKNNKRTSGAKLVTWELNSF